MILKVQLAKPQVSPAFRIFGDNPNERRAVCGSHDATVETLHCGDFGRGHLVAFVGGAFHCDLASVADPRTVDVQPISELAARGRRRSTAAGGG